MPQKPLPQVISSDFFARKTLQVAKDLLGCFLVCRHPTSGKRLAFKICETEAYTQDDPACHAYQKKPVGRAATLFREPGLSYVYLIYGMHHCLNVVTEKEGTGAAVLFRGLEPPAGYAELNTKGPGRLCRALGITRDTHNERLMTNPKSLLYIVQGPKPARGTIIQTTRIGITKAVDYPWRFYLKDSDYVSVKET